MSGTKTNMPLFLGLAAAGGVGYYLYKSGGDVKGAEKKFESDMHKAGAKIRGDREKAEHDAQRVGAEAGAKIDATVAKAESDFTKAKADAEALAKDAKADALKKVDAFDKKVEEGAAKAKSGISSWFGGK